MEKKICLIHNVGKSAPEISFVHIGGTNQTEETVLGSTISS